MRLALFALFAAALLILRDALSERWTRGRDRAQALLGTRQAQEAPGTGMEP